MNAPRILIPPRISEGIARGTVRQLDGTCMGTSWRVRFADEGRASEDLTGLIAALLERIENQMSHFRAHSELCRFATLPVDESLALSPEFARVLSAALDVARLSDGAFDPTVAPLVDAWGFGASLHYTDSGFVPPSAAIIRPSAAGWQQVDLDADNRLRQTGNVALNLAAIAKGFAVDAVSELLTQSGWPHHLVEIGGELRGAGQKPDGQPWWVALELPAADCPLTATRIALHGLSVATSGDYRRSYQSSARRLQHTLDPRSGAPVAHRLASVTVIHPECMLADAWATAIMVLGLGDGLALAEKMNLCVLLQGRDAAGQWVEASSAGWQAMLQS